MERYSKKRQAILDCLRDTTAHPGATWIYERLKAVYPDLSLATVYRNLIQLKEAGLVRSMGTVNGEERFDANVAVHPHARCGVCGAIMDLDLGADLQPPPEVLSRIEEKTGFSVERTELQFVGVCRACAGKERRSKEDK